MGEVVAIGEPELVGGWALAGVRLATARAPEQVHGAWAGLGPEVTLVLLTATAAEVLGAVARSSTGPIAVVMPP